MAIQVINDPYASRSAGLGSAVGSSLGGILQGLANMQLQEFAERKQSQRVAEGLSAMGVPDEVSSRIASLPSPLQKMFLTQFFGSEAFGPTGADEQAMPSEAPEGAREMGTVPGEAGMQPFGLDQQMQLPEQISQQEQQLLESMQAPIGQTGDMLSQLSPETQDLLSQATGPQMAPVAMPSQTELPTLEIKRPAARRETAPEGASRQGRAAFQLQRKPTAKKSFRELLATPRPTVADKNKAEEMFFKRQKFVATEQREIDKGTQKFYDTTLSSAKDARENDMRLNRMKQLNNKGNLTPSLFSSLLDTASKGIFGVGLNLKWLQSPDSQEFDKLSKDFLKNAKSIFGARVTQQEIQMFLETVPTLSQTPEARSRLIRNMKLMNEASKIKKKAMEEAIDMNGGERPKNLELIVDKKVASKLDALSEAFKIGKKRYLPKGRGPTAGGAFWGALSLPKKIATGIAG